MMPARRPSRIPAEPGVALLRPSGETERLTAGGLTVAAPLFLATWLLLEGGLPEWREDGRPVLIDAG